MDLNVCLMNDSFPPTIDGVANAVLNYARNITAAGERCAVATPAYPDVTDDYAFPVVRYPSLNTTQLTGYRAGVPFAPETIVRLADMKFDLVHTHCPIASTVLARSLRDACPMPVVFTYHTKFDIDIANAIRSERLQQVAIDLLVKNISACDEVWVVSDGAGENLRALGYTGDYRVMPNGVDLERGRASVTDTAALSADWDLPADAPVFLFLGRMMWYKGLRIILDGLKRLQDAGHDFCVVFVGDGQDRPEVEEYALSLGLADRCRFVGAVHDREIIRAWYTRADLLLFPSTFDTNGLVVREAAACGLGSLLVRGSCAAEGITDGRNGILIEENAASLAAVLARPEITRETFAAIGQHAMDEIYLSWSDSVAAARARYQIVRENWDAAGHKPDENVVRAYYELRQEVRGNVNAARDAMNAVQEHYQHRRHEAMQQLHNAVSRAQDYVDRYL
ncbi:MAG: glycosyltransferase [Oscillospiraceae bacterium]|nr:glycosyltransferase [Oscillospiraceae bacterium]